MPTRREKRARAPVPWWLGGHEGCEFCLASYCLEMETRCVSCDRPCCPMCAAELRVKQAVLCRDCQRAEVDHGG